MSTQYGVAILGTGMVADYHHQAVEAQDNAHLVAVSHHNPDKFAELSARFGVPCLAYDEVLARADVDVICICTPSGQHAEQTIQAAEAGKHVLVEKPMALTLKDADAMIAACDRAGVSLGVALQRRAEPLFQQIKAATEAGDLGDLTLGVVTIPYVRDDAYYTQADWRGTWALDGGGVLMNQGIHLVDLLIWLMGDPVSVQAYADTLHRNVEVEDTLAASLKFANGSLATITATTTAAPGFAHRLEVYGTQGGIQVVGENVSAWGLAAGSPSHISPIQPQADTDAGSGGDPRGIKPSGHIQVLSDLLTSIDAGKAPSIDGREGKRSLKTILDIYAAAGLDQQGDNHVK
ncbi:MAG: Gfo/Idh/MocA family oxidoreductase [Deinococcota bacterium]